MYYITSCFLLIRITNSLVISLIVAIDFLFICYVASCKDIYKNSLQDSENHILDYLPLKLIKFLGKRFACFLEAKNDQAVTSI